MNQNSNKKTSFLLTQSRLKSLKLSKLIQEKNKRKNKKLSTI